MVNFHVNLQPFLLAGMTVDRGWNRPSQARVALGGEPTREHEDYAIVSINPMTQQGDQLRPMLNVTCEFLEHTRRVRVVASHLSPLGLGLIRLRTVTQRDQLVWNSPYNLGPGHVVTVVKHDEGFNFQIMPLHSCLLVDVPSFPSGLSKGPLYQSKSSTLWHTTGMV